MCHTKHTLHTSMTATFVGMFSGNCERADRSRARPESGFQRAFGVRELAAEARDTNPSPHRSFLYAPSPGAKGRGTQGIVIRQLPVGSCQWSVRKGARAEALAAICRPCRDSPFHNPTHAAAAGWAMFCRPARRDWSVVGSGSIDVPGLRCYPFDFARGRSVDAKGSALAKTGLGRVNTN
jgi:hypothetical protein